MEDEIVQLRAEVASLRKLVADTRHTYSERLKRIEDSYATSVADLEAEIRALVRDRSGELSDKITAARDLIDRELGAALERIREQARDPFVGVLFKVVAKKVKRPR